MLPPRRERQVQRLKTLQGQGMTSTQALEDAEVRRNNAQSDLVAARARVATARQQIGDSCGIGLPLR